MTLSIMLSLLVIGTEEHLITLKINELQGWELVDKGLQDDGGIVEFYLKNKKDTVIIAIPKAKEWEMVKDFFNKNTLNISEIINKTNINDSWKYKEQF